MQYLGWYRQSIYSYPKAVVCKQWIRQNYCYDNMSYELKHRVEKILTYLTAILKMNVSPMQTWRIVHDLGIVSKRPKLALEHGEDYGEKKRIVDNYKKVSVALLKKDTARI